MKFELRRIGVVIVPEDIQDRAYIEHLLGLLKDGDSIPLVRRDDSQLMEIAYLETCPQKPSLEVKWRSFEPLSHFNCPSCRKWFSISEAPIGRTQWTCPWCNVASEYK